MWLVMWFLLEGLDHSLATAGVYQVAATPYSAPFLYRTLLFFHIMTEHALS